MPAVGIAGIGTGGDAEDLGTGRAWAVGAGFGELDCLVVFDPAAIVDESTIDHPWAPPKGIPDVMVSGVWVVTDGKVTGAHPGKVIRHTASR